MTRYAAKWHPKKDKMHAAAALAIFYSRAKRADWTGIEDVRKIYSPADAVKAKPGRTLYVFNLRVEPVPIHLCHPL